MEESNEQEIEGVGNPSSVDDRSGTHKGYRKGVHKDYATGLAPKQKKFADVYMATGDGTQAIKEAYGDVKYPAQMAYNLKQKGEIINYIQANASRAAEIQVEMMESKRTPAQVRYNITKDMLDRAGIRDSDEPSDDKQFSIGNLIIKVEK